MKKYYICLQFDYNGIKSKFVKVFFKQNDCYILN